MKFAGFPWKESSRFLPTGVKETLLRKPKNSLPKQLKPEKTLGKEKTVPLERLPREWQEAINHLSRKKGIFFLLGGADSGKTTFALALANSLRISGIKAGLVDSDVGQSTFGPPTTVSMVTVTDRDENLRSLKPQSLYFVGNNSPKGHFLEVIVGTKRMVEKAEESGASSIIIDTSGLIAPFYGTTLKYHKIDLLQPTHVVAFERRGELKEILSAIQGNNSFQIIRLNVPHQVKKISPLERYERRKKNYKRYFSTAKEIELGWEKIAIYPPKLDLFKARDPFNLLIGLRDELGETLGLGILTGLSERSLKVLTPVSEAKKVSTISTIVLGALKVEPSGEEVGRITVFKS